MTRPDPTAAARQQRRRARVREAGRVLVRVLAHPDDAEAIRDFARDVEAARMLRAMADGREVAPATVR